MIGDPHRKIQDLVGGLATRLRAMEDGQFGLEDLDHACDEAREVYERLVVIRHKARERSARPAAEPRDVGREEPAKKADGGMREAPPVRLEISPPEGSRQIDLIEAIEGQKKTRPAKTPKATLAEKIHHAPIKELSRSIALSQKFWFTAELFGKDATAFEQTIKHIDSAAGLDEARELVRSEVLSKLKKPPGEDVLAAFMELVERRFK